MPGRIGTMKSSWVKYFIYFKSRVCLQEIETGDMMKKITIIILSCLIFTSCATIQVNRTKEALNSEDYDIALKNIENLLLKDQDNIEYKELHEQIQYNYLIYQAQSLKAEDIWNKRALLIEADKYTDSVAIYYKEDILTQKIIALDEQINKIDESVDLYWSIEYSVDKVLEKIQLIPGLLPYNGFCPNNKIEEIIDDYSRKKVYLTDIMKDRIEQLDYVSAYNLLVSAENIETEYYSEMRDQFSKYLLTEIANKIGVDFCYSGIINIYNRLFLDNKHSTISVSLNFSSNFPNGHNMILSQSLSRKNLISTNHNNPNHNYSNYDINIRLLARENREDGRNDRLTMSSLYLAEIRKIQNPDYINATNRYIMAVSEYETAHNKYTNYQAACGYSYTAEQYNVVNNLSSIAMTKNAAAFQAKNILKNTPKFNEEPVYLPYEYYKYNIELESNVVYQIQVIDNINNQEVFNDSFTFTKNASREIVQNVYQSDKSKIHNRSWTLEDSRNLFNSLEKNILDDLSDDISILTGSYIATKSSKNQFEELEYRGQSFAFSENVLNPIKSIELIEYVSNSLYLDIQNIDRVQRPNDIFNQISPGDNSSYEVISLDSVIKNGRRATVSIKTLMSTGTGFFYSSGGDIMTNAHVIGTSKDILIELQSGETFYAEILYKNENLDIAILHIDYIPVSYLSFRPASSDDIGHEVLAIGNPFGLDFSITKGIISSIRSFSGIEYIQTDAAINSGNSGGPLLDNEGYVVGMNTFVIKKDISEGLNFALSSTEIIKIIL